MQKLPNVGQQTGKQISADGSDALAFSSSLNAKKCILLLVWSYTWTFISAGHWNALLHAYEY